MGHIMSTTVKVLASKPQVESIQSGLDESARKKVSGLLGDILGSTYRLLVKTHVHHRNIVGPPFPPLHAMLEEQYEQLFEATDLYTEGIARLASRRRSQ